MHEVEQWRRSARRNVLITLLAVATTASVIALGAIACVEMPGDSFRGTPPSLSEAERALADELRAHVEALAINIGERRADLGDSLLRSEEYIRASLISRVPSVMVRREALEGVEHEAANLVLDLSGDETEALVLIGAHYDTAPGGTLGANDNGTGTAALIALASRLGKRRHRLPIRLVFFANEEPPHFQTKTMGSLQHAAGCAKRGEKIRAMLSLETMGYYSEAPGSQHYPPLIKDFYPDRGNFIAFVGNVGSLFLVREAVSLFREHATIPSEGAALSGALPGVGWSDHWSFWQQGYSAVMVTDTAVFRDPNYHRNSDVVANINFEKLARVVTGLERTIEQLAGE
jgi:hypothetical protein